MAIGQYKVRSRAYCYDPAAAEPYRISRSKIDLFIECPRCFYLDQRFGIGRPSMPPFSLNNAVDELLKREFDAHRAAGSTPPLLKEHGVDAVPLRHERIEEWRDSLRRGVQYFHEPTNLIVRGGIDDVWVTPGGELLVVDYKATSKKTEISIDAAWQDAYKRQIEVYQWLLRHNGFPVSDTGYFVYVNGRTDGDAFNGTLLFDTHLISYTGSDEWVEPAIHKISACLRDNRVPSKNEECEYCAYRESAGHALLENQKHRKRTPSAAASDSSAERQTKEARTNSLF